MGKRDQFWSEVPTDPDGNIRWPEDPVEREALVRAAFGARVVGAVEAILSDLLAVVDGVPPEPGTNDFQAEAARRRAFREMPDDQRREIARLLKEACFGTLYWILAKLEHFPLGDVDFKVEPYTPEGKMFSIVGIEKTELQHLYFDWLEQFSDLFEE